MDPKLTYSKYTRATRHLAKHATEGSSTYVCGRDNEPHGHNRVSLHVSEWLLKERAK